METIKTKLQIIREQLEAKMTRAIVEAIEDGAKVEKVIGGGVYIDKVYITPRVAGTSRGLVLDIECDELEEALSPTADDLKIRAAQLRAELNKIENQLKEDKQ